MLSTPPNTSPVERGYSKLEMVCDKRRNHLKPINVENLFLLAVLNVPIKEATDYKEEISYLEK